MKKINFTILILLLALSCSAQNKKEQIATLNKQVDSLGLVINNQNIELDLLTKDIVKLKEEVSKLNNTLFNNTGNIEELELQIVSNKKGIEETNLFIEQVKEVFWYKPTEENIVDDWKFFRPDYKINEGPYFVAGDFDNNGVSDEAWILINHTETKMRFCVYMNGNIHNTIIQQFDFSYGYYIAKAEAGTYETYCGRYNECENGEPAEFIVKNSAIYFGFAEKGFEIYVWQNSKFVSFTISD